MAAGKKEMANKTISLRPSCSKDTSTSMLVGEFNDSERAAGNGESLLLFSRKNAMLGSLPWTSSPRSAGQRRGAPQHSLHILRRGFVRKFRPDPHAGIRAHRTTAKKPQNSQQKPAKPKRASLPAAMHAKPYHIMSPAQRQNRSKHTYTAERALPKPNLAPPSNQSLCRCPPQAAPHVDGQNLAPNNISTRNKVANDICLAKAHPQSPSDSNTTNNTGNTTGFPYALSLTTPPPRTYATMAAEKTELPARPTQASNLNSVFPPTPPEGPADDPTAEQKNKFSRATLRTQYLLSSLDHLNKSSVTAALHKWKHHTHSYHHIPKTASTITIKSSIVMYNFGVGPRFAYVSASSRAPK
jgi:hypothetical protein